MTRRRRDRPELWWDWLWSALLGIGLALALIFFLGRAHRPEVPEQEPGSAAQEQGDADRSLGFEFTVRFRVLLPRDKDG